MRISLLFLFLITLISSCMKQQSHEIAAPETPHYKISGFVIDIDTGEKMTEIPVTFHPEPDGMPFDCSLTNQIVTSDDTAHYEISLCPGNYTVTVKRDNFPVLEMRLTIGKSDRTIDLKLPSVLATTVFHTFKNIEGICRKNGKKLAVAAWFTIEGAGNPTVHRIFEGNFPASFKLLDSGNFAEENPSFHGLAFTGENYYSVIESISNPQFVKIDDHTGQALEKFTLSQRLSDLTYDGQNLWGTAPIGKIIRFKGTSTEIIEEFPSPGQSPSGIAWDGAQMYSCDSGAGHVFKHNPDLSVAKTFKPIYFRQDDNVAFPIDYFSVLEADSSGNLFLVKQDTIFCFIP